MSTEKKRKHESPSVEEEDKRNEFEVCELRGWVEITHPIDRLVVVTDMSYSKGDGQVDPLHTWTVISVTRVEGGFSGILTISPTTMVTGITHYFDLPVSDHRSPKKLSVGRVRIQYCAPTKGSQFERWTIPRSQLTDDMISVFQKKYHTRDEVDAFERTARDWWMYRVDNARLDADGRCMPLYEWVPRLLKIRPNWEKKKHQRRVERRKKTNDTREEKEKKKEEEEDRKVEREEGEEPIEGKEEKKKQEKCACETAHDNASSIGWIHYAFNCLCPPSAFCHFCLSVEPVLDNTCQCGTPSSSLSPLCENCNGLIVKIDAV
jgi:hypothetical protein